MKVAVEGVVFPCTGETDLALCPQLVHTSERIKRFVERGGREKERHTFSSPFLTNTHLETSMRGH